MNKKQITEKRFDKKDFAIKFRKQERRIWKKEKKEMMINYAK